MTSPFHQIGSDEGAESLLDVLGETVTYKNADGEERQITAAVNRGTPGTPPTTGQRSRPNSNLTVLVRNSATLGITRTELNIGSDVLIVSTKVGGTAEERPIRTVVAQSFGMLELEVA